MSEPFIFERVIKAEEARVGYEPLPNDAYNLVIEKCVAATSEQFGCSGVEFTFSVVDEGRYYGRKAFTTCWLSGNVDQARKEKAEQTIAGYAKACGIDELRTSDQFVGKVFKANVRAYQKNSGKWANAVYAALDASQQPAPQPSQVRGVRPVPEIQASRNMSPPFDVDDADVDF